MLSVFLWSKDCWLVKGNARKSTSKHCKSGQLASYIQQQGQWKCERFCTNFEQGLRSNGHQSLKICWVSLNLCLRCWSQLCMSLGCNVEIATFEVSFDLHSSLLEVFRVNCILIVVSQFIFSLWLVHKGGFFFVLFFVGQMLPSFFVVHLKQSIYFNYSFWKTFL